jgi:hypothetical protein
MFITGKNNYVTLGQLIPNNRTEIKSLKDFFYKTKKTEDEIKEHLKDKERIVIEFDPEQIPIEEEKEVKKSKKNIE